MIAYRREAIVWGCVTLGGFLFLPWERVGKVFLAVSWSHTGPGRTGGHWPLALVGLAACLAQAEETAGDELAVTVAGKTVQGRMVRPAAWFWTQRLALGTVCSARRGPRQGAVVPLRAGLRCRAGLDPAGCGNCRFAQGHQHRGRRHRPGCGRHQRSSPL